MRGFTHCAALAACLDLSRNLYNVLIPAVEWCAFLWLSFMSIGHAWRGRLRRGNWLSSTHVHLASGESCLLMDIPWLSVVVRGCGSKKHHQYKMELSFSRIDIQHPRDLGVTNSSSGEGDYMLWPHDDPWGLPHCRRITYSCHTACF